MKTNTFIPIILGTFFASLPLVITQLECQPNVQNHIENVVDQRVDQTVEERTIDLNNVVASASKIIHEIVLPELKEKLMEKFAEEKEAGRNAIREELRSEFQVQFNEKEQELIAKLEAEKEELLADFEQEMRIEKAAMRLELQQNVDEKQAALVQKVDEKQAALEQKVDEKQDALERKVDEKQAALEQSLQNQVNKMNEKVIFAAVRSSSGNMGSRGTITFDSLTTNIGNGMDSSTGKFTCPTSGLYMFTFSAVSSNLNADELTIIVKKNGSQMFLIDDEEGTYSGAKERNIAYSWILDLSIGDTVYLDMNTGGLHADGNSNGDQAHFTGHLLHAN